MSRNAKANFVFFKVIGGGEGRGVDVGEDDCIFFKRKRAKKITSSKKTIYFTENSQFGRSLFSNVSAPCH